MQKSKAIELSNILRRVASGGEHSHVVFASQINQENPDNSQTCTIGFGLNNIGNLTVIELEALMAERLLQYGQKLISIHPIREPVCAIEIKKPGLY